MVKKLYLIVCYSLTASLVWIKPVDADAGDFRDDQGTIANPPYLAILQTNSKTFSKCSILEILKRSVQPTYKTCQLFLILS